jgi:hypothetical protein
MSQGGARSFRRGDFSAADLSALLQEVAKGTFGGLDRVRRRIARSRADGPEYYDEEADVLLHDGDLAIEGDFVTARQPLALLVVRGDLIVSGRFEDSLDPESLVIVTGQLRARDLVSEGFLEVHGSVCVERAAVFCDNDGCAEIFGDLAADLVYTKYHAVQVHGRVRARLATGDAAHVRAAEPYGFIAETDDRMFGLLARPVLVVVGDEDDPEDRSIDYVDSGKLVARVRAGEPVLAGDLPAAAKDGKREPPPEGT